MNYVLLAIAGILFLVGVSTVLSIIVGRICPLPSSNNVVKTTISMIRKYDTGKGDIADIGSGYGSLLFRLASAFPERNIIGYEVSVVPYVMSLVIRFVFGYKNVEIVFGDAFRNIEARAEKLSSAVAYLCALERFDKSLKVVLRDSVENVLLLNTYKLVDVEAVEESGDLDLFKSRVYVYRG